MISLIGRLVYWTLATFYLILLLNFGLSQEIFSYLTVLKIFLECYDFFIQTKKKLALKLGTIKISTKRLMKFLNVLDSEFDFAIYIWIGTIDGWNQLYNRFSVNLMEKSIADITKKIYCHWDNRLLFIYIIVKFWSNIYLDKYVSQKIYIYLKVLKMFIVYCDFFGDRVISVVCGEKAYCFSRKSREEFL